MDLGTVAQWGAVALSLVAIIIAWINRRTDKIQDLDGRQNRFDSRLQKVEAELSHMPGKDLVTSLQISMAEMKGQMEVIAERVRPIQAMTNRLQESMLEGHSK